MQSPDEGRLVSSHGGGPSRESPVPIEARRKKRTLGAGCLIWAVLASVCLMLVHWGNIRRLELGRGDRARECHDMG